jgi:hypothetical protein
LANKASPSSVKIQSLSIASLLSYAKNDRRYGIDFTIEHLTFNMFEIPKEVRLDFFQTPFEKIKIAHLDTVAISCYVWNEYLLLPFVTFLTQNGFKGYSSFNSIVLDRKNGAVGLLSSIPYSNRYPPFLSEKERKLFEKNKIEDPERHQAIEKYLEAEDAYNQKTIYFSSIRTNHDPFKAQNPSVELTHILDRGHDDASLFELIDGELQDKFVIRMKGSRNSTVQAFNETKQKEMFVKMGVVSFAHRAEKTYEKVHFNKKVYVKPHAIFEWDTICIHNCTYNIVRVRFFDCKGVPIFKEPMLIITNHEAGHWRHCHCCR